MVQFGEQQYVPSKRIAALNSYLILNCTEEKKKRSVCVFLLFQEEVEVFCPEIPYLYNGNTKKFLKVS